MIFQTPQWSWRSDPGPVRYGFVHNTVNIYPKSGGSILAYVAVPTEFFQLLPLIFKEPDRTHAAVTGTEFYLDEDERFWVFGIESVDGKVAADLWPYIQSKTPPWVDLALRRRR